MLERTSPFGETGVLNNSHYANIVEEIPCSLCSELLSVITSLSQQLREVSVTVHGATEPAKVGMSAQGPAASGRPSDASGAPAHAQDADTQASNRQRPISSSSKVTLDHWARSVSFSTFLSQDEWHLRFAWCLFFTFSKAYISLKLSNILGEHYVSQTEETWTFYLDPDIFVRSSSCLFWLTDLTHSKGIYLKYHLHSEACPFKGNYPSIFYKLIKLYNNID